MNPRRISCRLRLRGVSSIIGLIAVMMTSIRLNADEATKQRFLNEYPAASQFLAERFRHVRCKFEIVEDLPPEIRIKNEFRKSGSSEKLESIRQVTTGGEVFESRHVIAMRDRPLFAIELEPEMQRFHNTKDVDSNPLVVLIRCFRESKTFRQAILNYRERITNYSWKNRTARQFEYECGQYVYAPWGLGPSLIERFMREPSFELIDAKALPAEPGIVEVRFRRMSEREKMEHVVKFDTNNHWAVTELTTAPATNPKFQFRAIVRYGPPIDGVAWPEVVEQNLGEAARFTHWSFEPTPASEFRLSHYGLRDPWIDWGDPKIQTLALLTMIGSTFAGFRFLRRRRRNKPIPVMTQPVEMIA